MATHQIDNPTVATRLNEIEGPPARTAPDGRPTPPPAQTGFDEPDNPLAHLTPEQIEQLGREFDAIHDEVFADLGDRDSRYIRSTIKLHRQLVLAARAMLIGSRYKPLWVGGTAALSVAKILENMEIGHNVMHGQWDWMNDPDINSQNWDWDTASPADAWRHSHNYEHHTFTNIRGKDRDLGYEIMRIDPHQRWHPVYLAQPFYNLLLMGFFEWGVAVHDLNWDAIGSGEKSKAKVIEELKAIAVKARRQFVKDYVAFPALSGRAWKSTLTANFTANIIRNMWAYSASRSSTTCIPTCPPVATPRSRPGCATSAAVTGCPTTPARWASSSAPSTARSCASPSRVARSGPSPAPTGPTTSEDSAATSDGVMQNYSRGVRFWMRGMPAPGPSS